MTKYNRVVSYIDNDTLQIIDLVAAELGVHRSALIRGILIAWARRQAKIREDWEKIVVDSENGVQVI
jgi:hypothetical protein